MCLSIHPDGIKLVVHVSVHPSLHPSVIHPSMGIFISDVKLSKCQWIFTKLVMCIDITEI